MKKIWIVFLVAALVFAVLWFFRWDIKEMPVYKGSQIIYLTDRWTGQQWVKYYGKHNGKDYAGEEYPKFGSGEFLTVEKSFLPSLGYKKVADERAQLGMAVTKAVTESLGKRYIIGALGLPNDTYDRMDALDKQLQRIAQQAANMASQKLTKEALAKRRNASYAWFSIVALLAVATLLSYLVFNRKPKINDISKEM